MQTSMLRFSIMSLTKKKGKNVKKKDKKLSKKLLLMQPNYIIYFLKIYKSIPLDYVKV